MKYLTINMFLLFNVGKHFTILAPLHKISFMASSCTILDYWLTIKNGRQKTTTGEAWSGVITSKKGYGKG